MNNDYIVLPQKFTVLETDDKKGVFEISGLLPGYGHTVGNALRRIIMSSIPGLAVVGVKIDGVAHEFEKIDGVREDVLTIVLNLKKLRFTSTEDLEDARVSLSVSGPKIVTGEDIETKGNLEVVNKDMPICEIVKNTKLHIELILKKGIGYAPKEMLHPGKTEIGMITVDGLFSPVSLVRYDVENMRVGSRTDYNKLVLRIDTDGTIKPEDVLREALRIMISQLVAIADLQDYENKIPRIEEGGAPADGMEKNSDINGGYQLADILKTRIESVEGLSARTLNALKNANIRTIGGLTQKTEEDILNIPGLGKKGLDEIKDGLKGYDLGLKD